MDTFPLACNAFGNSAKKFLVKNTYAYDIRGNMSSLTDNIDPQRNQAYGYDNLNRLTSFKCHNTGNRPVLPGMQTTYNYTNQRLVSTTPAAIGGDTFAFSYNGSGDVTQVTKEGVTNKLVFDRLHNVTSYTDASDNPIASFTYDGDGMRVIKTTPTKTIVYHYGVGGNILSETDQTGNVITDYVYVNGKMVAKKDVTAGVSFYHTDPAGTPIAMTASNGGIVWQADYMPFGEENEVAGTVDNNKEFIGKEKDAETGLYYFGARYMEAMIGRFVSPDPVGVLDENKGKLNGKMLLNPQRLNRYAYGLNNPTKYIDSDGLWSEKIHAELDPAFANEDEGITSSLWPWATHRHFTKLDKNGVPEIQKALDAAIEQGDQLGYESLVHQGQDAFNEVHQEGPVSHAFKSTLGKTFSDGKDPDSKELQKENYEKMYKWTQEQQKKWYEKWSVLFPERNKIEGDKKE